jgi:small conductance mechanosensitive channel
VGIGVTITMADLRTFADVYLIPLGMKILLALAIFIVGRWISRWVLRFLDKLMERGKVDISLRKFLGDVAYAVLLVVVIVAALDTAGVRTTAVVAVLGAAGLAIGLALQGSLSNFAAGVMLILLRPYRIGDQVTIGKYLGRVDAIRVFQTILITADNREITIPNGQIIAAPIENMTVLGRRRVDLVVTVAHPADLGQLRLLLDTTVAGDDRIETTPKPSVEVAEITDANVKLYLRTWTKCDDYAAVATHSMERIKVAMEQASLKYSVAIQGPS